MRSCKKCGSDLPFLVKVDGKTRNIKGRKYCLVCSPFGVHNTRKLHLRENPNQCIVCGLETGKVRGRFCNTCLITRQRIKRKRMLIEAKGGKCIMCGYSNKEYHSAFCFHHRDPSIKEFQLSEITHIPWERIINEADKCDLLCVRCHAEVHADEQRALKPFLYEEFSFCIGCNKWVLDVGQKSHLCSLCTEQVKIKKSCKTRRQTRCPGITELETLIKTGTTWRSMGKKYGVSDNAVRKWARKYNLIQVSSRSEPTV